MDRGDIVGPRFVVRLLLSPLTDKHPLSTRSTGSREGQGQRKVVQQFEGHELCTSGGNNGMGVRHRVEVGSK